MMSHKFDQKLAPSPSVRLKLILYLYLIGTPISLGAIHKLCNAILCNFDPLPTSMSLALCPSLTLPLNPLPLTAFHICYLRTLLF